MMKTLGCWFSNQTATWFKEGIHKLVPSYKCLNVKGDYVEKYTNACFCIIIIKDDLDRRIKSYEHVTRMEPERLSKQAMKKRELGLDDTDGKIS